MAGTALDGGERDGGVFDQPGILADAHEADRFATQGIGDEDGVASPLDLAVAPDLADLDVPVVVGRGKPSIPVPLGGPPDPGRRDLAEGFVRPLGVVRPDDKTPTLPRRSTSGRLRTPGIRWLGGSLSSAR